MTVDPDVWALIVNQHTQLTEQLSKLERALNLSNETLNKTTETLEKVTRDNIELKKSNAELKRDLDAANFQIEALKGAMRDHKAESALAIKNAVAAAVTSQKLSMAFE